MSQTTTKNVFLCALALAGVLLSACSASASLTIGNLYVDLEYASGGGLAGSSGHTINVDASTPGTSDVVTLNVYAVVYEGNANIQQIVAGNINQDTFLALNTAFATYAVSAGTALRGDVSFAGWHSTGVNPVATTNGSGKGVQSSVWTPQGSLGLGGTNYSSDTTPTHWYGPTLKASGASNIYVNSSGGVVSSSDPNAVATEWLLGQVKVNFDPYSSGWSSSPSALTSGLKAGLYLGNPTLSQKSYSFVSTTNSAGVYGSAATVGDGLGSAGNLIYAPLTFSFSGASSGGTNAGVLGASLSINGATTVLGSSAASTIPLTGTVSNTATSPAYAVNWGSSTTQGASVTLNPPSGSVAVGTPVSLTGTLPVGQNTFGLVQSTVTFTGTDTNGSVSPSVSQSLTASVIGHGTVVGSTSYGVTLTSISTAIPSGGLVTTLGTQTTAPYSFGLGQTSAAILAGNLNGTITEQYRSPTTAEKAGQAGLPVYSDVVNVQGAAGAGAHEVQVTYDPAAIGAPGRDQLLASENLLFLGYNNAGTWQNAVLGLTAGTQAVENYQGSYASYAGGSFVGGYNLAQAIGAYGVDTANHTVWAVVGARDGEFAAVPEPGTIGLLVAGAAALGFAYRRRKAVKA